MYLGVCGGCVDVWVVDGGSMEVIFLREGSVRTRLFSYGLAGVAEGLRAAADFGLDDLELGVERGTFGAPPGRRDCVMKVRLVSTSESLVRISLQIASMISSSFKKLTSRFVGCTFTSTRCGSMSKLR